MYVLVRIFLFEKDICVKKSYVRVRRYGEISSILSNPEISWLDISTYVHSTNLKFKLGYQIWEQKKKLHSCHHRHHHH